MLKEHGPSSSILIFLQLLHKRRGEPRLQRLFELVALRCALAKNGDYERAVVSRHGQSVIFSDDRRELFCEINRGEVGRADNFVGVVGERSALQERLIYSGRVGESDDVRVRKVS